MIMYQKTNPVGVDYFINQIQICQQREFPTLFGVSESTCNFYGRAEEVTKNNESFFAVFVSGKKYVSIGLDTKLSFISYLTLSDPSTHSIGLTKQECSLYCHGNLENIYSSINHRADQEFRDDMNSFILRYIEFSDYLGIEIIESELQPFHSFKLNFAITY